MAETISGWQLGEWLEDAKAASLALGISPNEIHWFLQELTGLDRLTLRLQTFKQQPSVPLQVPWSELTQLWQRRLTERIPVPQSHVSQLLATHKSFRMHEELGTGPGFHYLWDQDDDADDAGRGDAR